MPAPVAAEEREEAARGDASRAAARIKEAQAVPPPSDKAKRRNFVDDDNVDGVDDDVDDAEEEENDEEEVEIAIVSATPAAVATIRYSPLPPLSFLLRRCGLEHRSVVNRPGPGSGATHDATDTVISDGEGCSNSTRNSLHCGNPLTAYCCCSTGV